MIDLERQIRDYYEQVIIPVTTDEFTKMAVGAPIRSRRTRVWALAAAFVVVLVSVGIAALIWGGNSSSMVDQPPTTPPVTEPPSTTTAGGEADLPGGWEQVASGEPWIESIVDIEAVPGGGFVVVAEAPWGVFWSSDGVEWLDADPLRQVTAYTPGPGDDPKTGAQVIAATDDHVALLDRVNLGVWVGDPRTGEWDLIRFDTIDLAGQTDLLAVASNQSEVLVVASAYGSATLEDETVDPGDEPQPIPRIDQYLVWVIDPTNGTVERPPLPLAAHWGGVDDTLAGWSNGQWVIYFERSVHTETEESDEPESLLLVSPDGVSWTKTAAPEWDRSLTSLTVGPETMIATVCNFGGDTFWYSEDGLNWEKADTSYLGHHSTYSETLGFVIVYGDLLVSADGKTWRNVETTDHPLSGIRFLAASGNTLLVGDGLRVDEEPRLWLWNSPQE